MRKYICVFLIAIYLVPSVCVADTFDEEIAQKTAQIEQLKSAIAEIDSEFLRCKKSKTTWTAATVIGGVGVVATGAAATIQAVKLEDLKDKKQPKKTNE